jgi:type IV pilus assembly protein PilW
MKVEIMPGSTRNNKSAGGFSLIEIMVGVAIGLLGVLIIMQVSSIFEGQRRTTTTGSDAQTTGAIAFYTMTRDLRRTGMGLSEPGVIGCQIRSYRNSAVATSALIPLTITKGAGGLPDQIHFLASGKSNWSIPVNLAKDLPQNTTDVYLTTALGLELNDVLVVFETSDLTEPCTMFQVSGPRNADNKLAVGIDLRVEHQHVSDQIGRLNPDDPTDLFPVAGYTNKALVFNFGGMIDHTYSVDANGNLLLADAAAGTQAVASDIVTIKAQYGFDDDTSIPWPPTGTNAPKVTQWSDAVIDADHDGTVGDRDDMQRMIAVRVALVARSPLIEKPDPATGQCDITISAATASRAANSPTWVGGAIDVSKNPDGTDNANWQCYRYKTFEDTIPLRNLMWRNN